MEERVKPARSREGSKKQMSQHGNHKLCRDCGMTRPMNDFHLCRRNCDGKQHYCKTCQNQRNRDCYSRRATIGEGTTDGSSSSSSENESTPEDMGESDGAHLYVMQNSRLPGDEYKIGRSKCVQKRRAILQACQNFEMVVIATFPGAGWAEGQVLERLAYARVKEGPGREWVKANLSEIFHVVGRAVEQQTS